MSDYVATRRGCTSPDFRLAAPWPPSWPPIPRLVRRSSCAQRTRVPSRHRTSHRRSRRCRTVGPQPPPLTCRSSSSTATKTTSSVRQRRKAHRLPHRRERPAASNGGVRRAAPIVDADSPAFAVAAVCIETPRHGDRRAVERPRRIARLVRRQSAGSYTDARGPDASGQRRPSSSTLHGHRLI